VGLVENELDQIHEGIRQSEKDDEKWFKSKK